VAVLKIGFPWKIVGREPCSQTPTYDTTATAGKQLTSGMLAIARSPPRNRNTSTNASNSRNYVEKPKVAGNEAGYMAVNAAVIKKIWWPWKVPKWPWFLLGVAVKARRDLAILFAPLIHPGILSVLQ
jgi:hypothetical protein